MTVVSQAPLKTIDCLCLLNRHGKPGKASARLLTSELLDLCKELAVLGYRIVSKE